MRRVAASPEIAPGIPFLPSYNVLEVGGAFHLLAMVVAVGFCVHLAARFMLKKDNVPTGLAAGAVGVLLAYLAFDLAPQVPFVGIALAIIAFIASVGIVYKTKMQGAVSVGALAWILWIVANVAIAYAQNHWHW
jgi:hypothetical protein